MILPFKSIISTLVILSKEFKFNVLVTGFGYKVISTVPNTFPQNVWADNRIVGGRHMVPYPWVQKTGVSGGGFFTKAIKDTRVEFKGMIIKDISNIEVVK